MVAEVQEQVTARALVLKHVFIHRLMGYGFLILLFHASGDLLRAPVLSQQAPDAVLHHRRHLDGLGFDVVALLDHAVGLPAEVATKHVVAGKLPANTGLGDPVLGDSRLPMCLNIKPLFECKVLVVHKE